MAKLKVRINQYLKAYVNFYSIDALKKLMVCLEKIEAIDAQEIVEDIGSLLYVTELQILYAESQGEQDKQLCFESVIRLDKELVIEEDQS